MTNKDKITLERFYEHVQKAGKLPTPRHARRFTEGVLKTLGTVLDGRTERALADALPEELGSALGRVFWLLHFPNSNMSAENFQTRVARRSGNSDPFFARYPAMAVFGGLQAMIDESLSDKVAEALPPEIRELWRKAPRPGQELEPSVAARL